ncbi:MAG: SMI1/KNR4 family protein [Pirellulaceae bacterium]
MSGRWSTEIENRYSLRLSDDVRAWLDEQVWRESGGGEFSRAQTPEQLLDPPPGVIWAGFMLPDTLPIIGNDYGDWLCLRIAADGTVSELVQWSHGGGDWIPYGRTLAEGLLYDAAVRFLYPHRASFAKAEPAAPEHFRAADWAWRWMTRQNRPVPRFWPLDGEPLSPPPLRALRDGLAAAGVAEFAIRRDRILEHLESPLKSRSHAALAQELEVSWEPEFVSWLFDTARIPPAARQQLISRLSAVVGDPFVQDWAAAEAEAAAVLEVRDDLGWAFDIAGWAAERRGAARLAVQRYLAGLQTSWFSDDTLQFRTHWFDEGYGKFAASRLAVLSDHLTPLQQRDPYLQIFLDNEPRTMRTRVQQHWISLAREASRRKAHREAYAYYYRAGWDLGMLPVKAYDEVLQQLGTCAQASGSPALAALAALHHRFLH